MMANGMLDSDPFLSSMLARPAAHRLIVAVALAGCLWLAIWWAVSLP